MGKIADALERHKKEKATKVEFLHDVRPAQTVNDDREIAFAKEFCTLHECSPKVIALTAPGSIDAENFRILRAQILLARNRRRPRTIMVTSTFPGEGKTFVAVNLSVSIALGIEEHVLLVDCDFRRPQIHEMFGQTNSGGLHEYLTSNKPLQELTKTTQLDRLSILPAGRIPPNQTEVASSSMLATSLNDMKEYYEDSFIVIDAPPSHFAAETKTLARYVDGIIFVVMALRSPRQEVQKTIQNLEKEKILGVVFNGSSQAHRSYNKYYDKYYKGK